MNLILTLTKVWMEKRNSASGVVESAIQRVRNLRRQKVPVAPPLKWRGSGSRFRPELGSKSEKGECIVDTTKTHHKNRKHAGRESGYVAEKGATLVRSRNEGKRGHGSLSGALSQQGGPCPLRWRKSPHHGRETRSLERGGLQLREAERLRASLGGAKESSIGGIDNNPEGERKLRKEIRYYVNTAREVFEKGCAAEEKQRQQGRPLTSGGRQDSGALEQIPRKEKATKGPTRKGLNKATLETRNPIWLETRQQPDRGNPHCSS